MPGATRLSLRLGSSSSKMWRCGAVDCRGDPVRWTALNRDNGMHALPQRAPHTFGFASARQESEKVVGTPGICAAVRNLAVRRMPYAVLPYIVRNVPYAVQSYAVLPYGGQPCSQTTIENPQIVGP
eukprot:gene10225-biopygen5546